MVNLNVYMHTWYETLLFPVPGSEEEHSEFATEIAVNGAHASGKSCRFTQLFEIDRLVFLTTSPVMS